MITITYNNGEVSLLTAILAGKQLIQHRAAGTRCLITQHGENTVVTVALAVDASGVITENIEAVPVVPEPTLAPAPRGIQEPTSWSE